MKSLCIWCFISSQKNRPTQRAPEPRQSTPGLAWWDASQARFHLCLRRGAGKQFVWLGVSSGKMVQRAG
jgi:hypothetical protein